MFTESAAGGMDQPTFDAAEGSKEGGQPRTGEGGAFQFLNFSNFDDTKAKETKSRVRSHVMHGVHQSKKGGKKNRPSGAIVLDTSSLLATKTQATKQSPETTLPDTALERPDRLGAGRNDPFQQYPIEMNRRTLELYDHRECFSAS
jgi:hypothetical protein